MRPSWSVGSPRHQLRGAGQFEQLQGSSALSTPRMEKLVAPAPVYAPAPEAEIVYAETVYEVQEAVAEVAEATQVVYQVQETACCRMLGLCNGREDFGVLRSFGWSADGSLERPL